MEESYPCVVNNPNIFKMKLGIGEEAYKFLRLQKNLLAFLEAGSFGLTGSSIASSAVVAQTFFSSSGFWAFLGIGTAATPVGWVIAAGVLSGIAYFGLSNIYKKGKDGKVIIVPKFINTPLDLLAVGLSDMILPLALELANADGEVAESEKENIVDYLVSEWGYDRQFIIDRLQHIETLPSKKSLKLLATSFAQFVKSNPDCNQAHISGEIIEFLDDLSRADGVYSRQEHEYIELVKGYFSGILKPTWKDIGRFWILRLSVSSRILARAFKRRFFSPKKVQQKQMPNYIQTPDLVEPDNSVLDDILEKDLKLRMKNESRRRRQLALEFRNRKSDEARILDCALTRPETEDARANNIIAKPGNYSRQNSTAPDLLDSDELGLNQRISSCEAFLDNYQGKYENHLLLTQLTHGKKSRAKGFIGFLHKVKSVIFTILNWTFASFMFIGSMYLIFRLKLLPAVLLSLFTLWLGKKIQKSANMGVTISDTSSNPVLASGKVSTAISVSIYVIFLLIILFGDL